MSRKVLGWNINQRSGLGKEIPELVFQELLAQDADIIVLTEVVKNDSLSVFIQKMREAGYEAAISKNENTNEVCILWKAEIYQLLNVDDSLITAKENDNPNYLMVELKDQNDKKFNVVGYRIRVGSKESVNEYEGVVDGRFCPKSVRSFCPIVAGFNAGTYKVPACVL